MPNVDKVIKFKTCQWFDKKTKEIIYGINSVHESGKVLHVCDDNGMINFKSLEQARKEIKKMNKEINKFSIG